MIIPHSSIGFLLSLRLLGRGRVVSWTSRSSRCRDGWRWGVVVYELFMRTQEAEKSIFQLTSFISHLLSWTPILPKYTRTTFPTSYALRWCHNDMVLTGETRHTLRGWHPTYGKWGPRPVFVSSRGRRSWDGMLHTRRGMEFKLEYRCEYSQGFIRYCCWYQMCQDSQNGANNWWALLGLYDRLLSLLGNCYPWWGPFMRTLTGHYYLMKCHQPLKLTAKDTYLETDHWTRSIL